MINLIPFKPFYSRWILYIIYAECNFYTIKVLFLTIEIISYFNLLNNRYEKIVIILGKIFPIGENLFDRSMKKLRKDIVLKQS